jgi:hypothetical protein
MKTHSTIPRQEQEPYLIGDSKVAEEFLKSSPRKAPFPGDPLANHIHSLLELHPSVALKFRGIKLTDLDTPTKQTLLDDINSVLGIRPLKNR